MFTILITLSLGFLLQALTISFSISVILTDGRGILEKFVDTNFGVIFSIIFFVMLDGVLGSYGIIIYFSMLFLTICGDLYNLLSISLPPNSLRNANMAQSLLMDVITAAAHSPVNLKLCLLREGSKFSLSAFSFL